MSKLMTCKFIWNTACEMVLRNQFQICFFFSGCFHINGFSHFHYLKIFSH